jgi:hypothetical protein
MYPAALGLRPTEGDESLVVWDFHDLLFHARSTEGRHANLVGGLYPYVGLSSTTRCAAQLAGKENRTIHVLQQEQYELELAFPVESLAIPMLLAPSPVHFYQDQR